jgi:hypothetical protein
VNNSLQWRQSSKVEILQSRWHQKVQFLVEVWFTNTWNNLFQLNKEIRCNGFSLAGEFAKTNQIETTPYAARPTDSSERTGIA